MILYKANHELWWQSGTGYSMTRLLNHYDGWTKYTYSIPELDVYWNEWQLFFGEDNERIFEGK